MINFGDTRLPERFWLKCSPEPNSNCWLWTGCLTNGGYGSFRAEDRQRNAHRYSYIVLVGPIAVGLELDHLCRVRCCCNPSHLEPVTKAVNIARGNARPPTRYGEAHHSATTTDAEVEEARRLRASGWRLIDICRRFGIGMSTASRWSRFAVRTGEKPATVAEAG